MNATPGHKSVEDLLELRKQDMLVANPEYQRGSVWTPTQKKRLVDSVLRGYPIPLIYLHHIKRSAGGLTREGYEVIDGQQRINALYDYWEGAYKLFHPEKDESEARFPDFIKKQPCPWGGLSFKDLPEETKQKFLGTMLAIVQIETHNDNEARDLFVRLQAGMPLNPQEKRDAWPGQFTDFVLKLAGKPEIARYPGHDFFPKLMKAKKTGDRGKFRQLAAQIAMLYFNRTNKSGKRFSDIKSASIDDFYYENLDFDSNSEEANRLFSIFDKLTQLLYDQKRKKIINHEAIHLVLLVDGLMDDYVRNWEANFAVAFDLFRKSVADASRAKSTANEAWNRYGIHTRVGTDRAETIQRRHEYFATKMLEILQPQIKDPQRCFGEVEREIIYYRDRKQCGVCQADVVWHEGEIHHIEGHALGGSTVLENGVLVHRHCHPKGTKAIEFAQQWIAKK